MLLKRTLPLLGIMLILAGCFRQAPDDFEPVGSQNTGEINITQEGQSVEPTSDVVVIDPNATESENNAQTADDATATPRVISPTQADDDEPVPTNTQLTIPTATQVRASASPQIPTATQPSIITPDFVEEVSQPTALPTATVSSSLLQATPTGVGQTTATLSDCDYAVQDGDNLFRIALNNNVTLADLLSANSLTEASIIQPGQVLRLPNCGDGSSASVEVEVTEETDLLSLNDCDIEIVAGDTLFTIAQANDVTLADLLEENDLEEDAVIQIGQIVTLPNCVDEDDLSIESEDSMSEETDTTTTSDETIHVVVSGDTLLTIARQYGVSVNDIIQANTIPDRNNLTVGQQLVIPNQ